MAKVKAKEQKAPVKKAAATKAAKAAKPAAAEAPSGGKAKVDRAEVLKALERAAPALAGEKTMIPAFKCFLLDGVNVLAYNGTFAVRAPCPWPVEGAAQGRLLMDLLSGSSAEAVRGTSYTENSLSFYLGKASLKLPLLTGKDVYALDLPKEGGLALPVPKDVAALLGAMSLSMGVNLHKPVHYGLTIACRPDGLDWYTTDDVSATYIKTDGDVPKDLNGKVIAIPADACDALAKLGDLLGEASWKVVPGSHLEVSHEDFWFMSRLNQASDRANLERLFGDAGSVKREVLPEGFDEVLKRTSVLLDASGDLMATGQIEKDTIRIQADTEAGDVDESLAWTYQVSKPFVFNPRLWVRVLGLARKLGFGKKLAVFSAKKPWPWRYITSVQEKV